MVATIRLADAKFRPGDILVHHAYYPDGSVVSRAGAAIAEIGRGKAYHVAVLDWTQRGWIAVEMVPPVGQEDPIVARITEHPGTIHWLSVPDVVALEYEVGQGPVVRCYNRDIAVAKAREYIGRKYGFNTIYRDWLSSSFGRWFSRLPSDDEILELQPVCSVLVLDALQAGFGGWDMILHLNLALTQPEDCNRICVLRDNGALIL